VETYRDKVGTTKKTDQATHEENGQNHGNAMDGERNNHSFIIRYRYRLIGDGYSPMCIL
jgi:hypothetical protein